MSEPESYWDFARPTYIENWPRELLSLSIAQVDIPLTLEEAEALGTNITELFELFPAPHGRDITSIKKRAHDAVMKFPKGGFIRLGSRSPKDSLYGYQRGFKVVNGEKALRVLLDISERVSDDLLMAMHHKYSPHIFIREWIDIPKWAEFRCFMKDRELVGISQYHYLDGYMPEIESNERSIVWAIEQFFLTFKEASHLDSVIFDVFLKMRKRDNEVNSEVKLLEINPFFEHTDPCLYKWTNGGDFDKAFRKVEKK